MAITSGAIAAAVFASTVMRYLNITEPQVPSAMVGLFAYRVAPIMVDEVSGRIAKFLASKINDRLPGGD